MALCHGSSSLRSGGHAASPGPLILQLRRINRRRPPGESAHHPHCGRWSP